MATASASVFKSYMPWQINVGKDVPDDAVLGIFSVKGKMGRKPMHETQKLAFNDFYRSLLGEKYKLTPKLPVMGMLIVCHRNHQFQPALVTSDITSNPMNDRPEVAAILIDSGVHETGFDIGDMRFMTKRFMSVIPGCLFEDPACARLVRETEHSSDDEIIDFLSLIPMKRIVFDTSFRYREEPLLKPLLDKKRNGTLGSPHNYWKDASIRIRMESVESPSKFKFSLHRDLELFTEMQEKMRKTYNIKGACEYLVPSELVAENLPVVAIESEKSLVRAYVLKKIHTDITKVQPVDGGAPFDTYDKNLRFLHKSLAEYPKFGYNGKLAGVAPVHGCEWTKAATDCFNSICVLGTDMKYILGVVNYFTAGGTAVLQLWTKDRRGAEIWAADEMVRRRMAREDRSEAGRLKPDQDEQAALLAELMARSMIIENPEQNAANKRTGGAASGAQGGPALIQ